MASETNTLGEGLPVIVYARLLATLHRLTVEGKGDSEEAEAIAGQMDAPWHAMSPQEQDRMRGLAADLNALKEGGPKRVDMAPEQFAEWQRAAQGAFSDGRIGNPDANLAFLRRPVPAKLPPQWVPCLQAWCWEKFGDLETALVFMSEADRLDPEQAMSMLLLLQRLERVGELQQYADRVITNPESHPEELYLAAGALLRPTQRMNDVEARPILERAVSVLKKSLRRHLAMPTAEKANAPADADAYIAIALGLALERLGQRTSAIEVNDKAIARHAGNSELYMARGLARRETDVSSAMADLAKAARLGVASIWPYLLLAQDALKNRFPAEALRWALAAEHQPGSAAARAEVYETIAIALAELGQSKERVFENFDFALALDPKNPRIRGNRVMADALFTRPKNGRTGWQRLEQPLAVQARVIRQDRCDLIEYHEEAVNEQRRSQVSHDIVGV